MERERFLTVKDVSEWLQVSKKTVYDWTHTEFIPHYKIASQVRFKGSEIERWLNKRKVKGRVTFKLPIEDIM